MRELAGGLERNKNELEQRNAEINTFYHTLAHELKTPLTAAREFVSIVMDQIAGPVSEEQHEYLGTAKICCDQIKIHIDDLLDMTRLETGKLALEQQHGSISQTIALALAATRSAAEQKDIVMRERVAANLPPVWVDERRIAQVLGNLIGNAIKFTPSGGEVVVSARLASDEAFVLVDVCDNGVGIEAHHRERIFDRLYQVRDDDATIKGGLGIGLSLCREIVRLHGGSIGVDSEPGRGSTFSFTLPALKPPAASSSLIQREAIP